MDTTKQGVLPGEEVRGKWCSKGWKHCVSGEWLSNNGEVFVGGSYLDSTLEVENADLTIDTSPDIFSRRRFSWVRCLFISFLHR